MKLRNKNAKTRTDDKPEQMEAQPKPAAPTPEQIQKRAYEIFRNRGGALGDEWRDWFLAEIQLKAEIGAQNEKSAE